MVYRLTITLGQWNHPLRIVLRSNHAWTFGSLCQIENAPNLWNGRMISEAAQSGEKRFALLALLLLT